MEKTGYIYKITNPNGKIYIGQTINLSSRKSAYRNLNIKGQELIKNSIQKYGWDNHTFEVIGEFYVSELNEREIFFIEHHNSFVKKNINGLNLTTGGDGSRGRKDSLEVINKRKQHHLGKKRSDNTRLLMSISKKGKPSIMLNKTHSEETKQKMSNIKKGKVQLVSTVNKRVNSMRDNFLKKHESILQYEKETNLLIKEWFETPKEIMRQTNFDDSTIIKCLKNKRKDAYNFVWKYKKSAIDE